MLSGIVILVGLATGLSTVLVVSARLLGKPDNSAVDTIERLLPRIQCAQCGYPGCRPYAEAIANGTADINRCPPGGTETIRALADVLGREPVPLDTSLGQASMQKRALIDESACIGCHRCAEACPVDAIAGLNQRMHTIIASHCTGCELCLPPCPVDCISMVERHA
jgi:H+/Na+-translocating ferredoxin:NAD+ oxidoreductase subunit B